MKVLCVLALGLGSPGLPNVRRAKLASCRSTETPSWRAVFVIREVPKNPSACTRSQIKRNGEQTPKRWPNGVLIGLRLELASYDRQNNAASGRATEVRDHQIKRRGSADTRHDIETDVRPRLILTVL